MRTLVLALALTLVPLAAAYPNHAYPCDVHPPLGGVDGACFGDVTYGAQECGDWGQHDGATGVAVMFDNRYFLDAGGFELCDTYPEGERQAHGVYVETATVTVAWAEERCSGAAVCETDGCGLWVYVAGRFVFTECPDEAAPPNPGWGSVLP